MASKRVKGITVVIDGDLTSLDKALKETNSSLSDTKKRLKEVERALKIDPKNIDLLAQKQRLLAQQSEDAAKKTKFLQETIEKSTADNDLYDKWIKSFSSMQREITKAENALSDLEKKQRELNDLGVDADSKAMVQLQKEIDETSDKLDAMRQNVVDTYEAMGRPISTEQLERMQVEITEAGGAAKDASRDLKYFESGLEQIGTTAKDVSDKAKSVSNAFAPVSKAAGVALGAMLGTVPATDNLRTSMSLLETNAQKAGISMESTADALKQFNRVSGDTDESVEALSNLLMGGATESNLQRAVENLAGAAIAFPETIKIESLADSLQETIASGEATGQFAELLTRLGFSVADFNTMLSGTQDQSTRLNMALDTLANGGMQDLYNSWAANNETLVKNKDSTLELQASIANLATALTPIITTVTKFGTQLLNWFRNLNPAAQGAILAILGVVASISPIAGLISNVSGAVSGLTELSGKFAGGVGNKVYLTFAKWALIITAVAAAVAALIAMINVLIGKGNETNQVLGSLAGSTGGVNVGGRSGVPGFANGGVFMPNHPVLGILGDNKSEVEIAAPKSAMQDAFLEALAMRGGGGAPKINIEFRGSLAQLGRVLQPVVTTETSRLGTDLLRK